VFYFHLGCDLGFWPAAGRLHSHSLLFFAFFVRSFVLCSFFAAPHPRLPKIESSDLIGHREQKSPIALVLLSLDHRRHPTKGSHDRQQKTDCGPLKKMFAFFDTYVILYIISTIFLLTPKNPKNMLL